MVNKSSDTKQELASTGPEREHRPDATGKLLERQKAVAKAHLDSKAGTDVAETPKRKTTSVASACRNFREVRTWFLKSILHREAGGGHNQYDLSAFAGPTAALPEIIEHHVKHRLSFHRDEQRFRELLKRNGQFPIEAPTIIVQKRSANPQLPGELIPQLRRPTGPSDFQSVVGLCVLLRSLSAVTNRDAILAVKSEVVRLDVALLHSIETFRPFDRPGIKPEDNRSTILYDDSNGKLIGEARMRLATATELVLQRERLRDFYLALKTKLRWLVKILDEVDDAAEAQVAEQENVDRSAQRTEALAMIAAGYETDHHGRRWDRFLSEQERIGIADRKTELERDLTPENENK